MVSLRIVKDVQAVCGKAKITDNTWILLRQIAIPFSTNIFSPLTPKALNTLSFSHGIIKNREKQTIIYHLLGSATSEIKDHEELLGILLLLWQSKLLTDWTPTDSIYKLWTTYKINCWKALESEKNRQILEGSQNLENFCRKKFPFLWLYLIACFRLDKNPTENSLLWSEEPEERT